MQQRGSASNNNCLDRWRFLRLDVVVDGDRLHVHLSSVLAPFSRQVALDDVVDVEVHDQLSRQVPGVWGRLRGVRTVPRVFESAAKGPVEWFV